MEEELCSTSYFHIERSAATSPLTNTHTPILPITDRDHEVNETQTHEKNEKNEIRFKRKMIRKIKLSKLNQETSIQLAEQRLFLRNYSIKKIQFTWRKYFQIKQSKEKISIWIYERIQKKLQQKRMRSVNLIQRQWKLFQLKIQQKLLQNFLQNGKWNVHKSHLVFGLILGYLTRLRMRKSVVIMKARLSLRDAWTVLEGLITDVANQTDGSSLTVEKLIFISLHSPQSMNSMKSIDWPFARMFIKEVLVSRGIIWKQMIACRRWCRSPPPGYWYYPVENVSKPMRTQVSSERVSVADSVVKISESNFENDVETSSNLQAKEKDQRPSNPQSLLELLKAKAKNGIDSRTKPASEEALQTIENQRVKDSYSQRPATAPSIHTQPPPVASVAPMVSAPKRKQTNNLKPYLQIDLISADKLAPVKGKVNGVFSPWLISL